MSRAEPSQFSWTGENQNNKPPAKRIPHKTVVEEYKLPLTETIDESILVLACDDFIDTSFETPQTEADPILDLQANIAALGTKITHCQQKLTEAEELIAILGRQQLFLDKSKHDNCAILFLYWSPEL